MKKKHQEMEKTEEEDAVAPLVLGLPLYMGQEEVQYIGIDSDQIWLGCDTISVSFKNEP